VTTLPLFVTVPVVSAAMFVRGLEGVFEVGLEEVFEVGLEEEAQFGLRRVT
jgi:hypothetical protein